MKIAARCHPLLEPLLPKPTLAKRGLPHWLKSMPGDVVSHTLGGEVVRTLKHCPPFIDAMSSGLLLHLVTDLTVSNGEVAWDWDPPIISDAPITRSPVGVHVPEQASGTPLESGGQLFVKFNNFWTLSVPEGWSLLFVHPLNRPDLPFKTLSGVVDCDGFGNGYVHFPAVVDEHFEGVIKRGTPMVQIIPIRRESVDLEISAMDENAIDRSAAVQKEVGTTVGVYRKNYRRSVD